MSAKTKVREKADSVARFAVYDPLRVYKLGEVCTTIEPITEKVYYWEWYSNVETLAGKDPLDESNRQVGWTDETKPFYWTPYKKARAGAILFPWLSETFPEGTLSVAGNSVPLAVFWRLGDSFPEFINAGTGMIDFPETDGEFFRVLDQGRGVDINRGFAVNQSSQNLEHQHSMGAIATTTVSGGQSYPASTGTTFPSGVSTVVSGGNESRPRNLAFPILVEV